MNTHEYARRVRAILARQASGEDIVQDLLELRLEDGRETMRALAALQYALDRVVEEATGTSALLELGARTAELELEAVNLDGYRERPTG